MQYMDQSALLEALEALSVSEPNPSPEKIQAVLDQQERVEIVHCRDCNTFSGTGVAEGYGWCKKFCFGPEEDFFCLLGEPWEKTDTTSTTEVKEGGAA